MTGRHRVAITGLGAISALGLGVEALLGAMAAGRCGIGPIATIPTARLAAPIAAEIREIGRASCRARV